MEIIHSRSLGKPLGSITAGILGFSSKIRFVHLIESLQADPHICSILLFWNLAPSDANELVDQLKNKHDKLICRTVSVNLGSAGGFDELMLWFSEDSSYGDYLLLLDDDLIPAPGCSQALIDAAAEKSFNNKHTLLMCNRIDLPEYQPQVIDRMTLNGPRAGVCGGVHWRNLLSAQNILVNPTNIRTRGITSAPYGGLCIPRPALDTLGRPIRDLFLYGDDTELTIRFTRAGNKIKFCQLAVIRDTETVWNATGPTQSNLIRRIRYLDAIKAYHELRNRNYLCLRFYPGNSIDYWINRCLLLSTSYIIATFYGHWSKARLVHKAITDSERLAKLYP